MKQRNLRMVAVWLALTFSIAAGWATAAVPESISYQGFLTDRFGTPYNEDRQISFAIYNDPAGGSPLWTEDQAVPVFQGLFSIELGSAVNPFPEGMFDTPLWLGITIESDSEMSPRRPLTSVGFAFKADDAASLQGLTPASLDQSDHVEDASNPHGVSVAQIGAASSAVFVAHAGNTNNPHAVLAADTGAVAEAELISHAAMPDVHHGRYSDSEAISALGPAGNGNLMNHDRYTDGEAFAAVTAADGEGSGLDADQIDGLEASEIIQAASKPFGRSVLDANGVSVGTVAGYYDNNSGSGVTPSLVVNVNYLGYRGIMLMAGSNISENYLTLFPGTYYSNSPSPVYMDGSCAGGTATAIGSVNNAQIAAGFVNFQNNFYAIDTSTTVDFIGTYRYQGGGCTGGNLNVSSTGFRLEYLGEMALPLQVQ